MAVTYLGGNYSGSASASSGGNSPTTLSFSVTTPSGTDILIVLLGAQGGSAVLTTPPNFNGVGLTKYGSMGLALYNLYYMVNPPIGTYTLSTTVTADRKGIVMATACYSGIDKGTPLTDFYADPTIHTTSPSTSAAITSKANGMVIMAGGVSDWPSSSTAAVSPAVNPSQKMVNWTDTTSSNRGEFVSLFHTAGTGGSVSITYTKVNANMRLYLMNLNPASGVPTRAIFFS